MTLEQLRVYREQLAERARLNFLACERVNQIVTQDKAQIELVDEQIKSLEADGSKPKKYF